MIIALQTLIFFRESFLTVLDRVLRPYYKRISIPFITNAEDAEDEEPDEQVFSEFDDEKGVIFFPAMYSQRYAAVSDCLMDERWRGKLEKVIDLGYHDMSFIRYLKEVPGIQRILGVDIESMPLRCSSDLIAGEEYAPKRESPLQITLFQGNAADPDYRLIGCDAVIAIEMIEHMLPHDLDRLVHNIFGFIKPWIVVITTPNGDFNVLFKSLEKNGYRRMDHFFEWSREQFNEWCSNIIFRYPNYSVTCQGIGPGPPGTLHYGCCSQLALFVNKAYHKQQDLNINSLALVPMPTPPPTKDMVESWGTAVLDNDKQAEIERIGAPYGIESLTEFICNENQSNATFVYSPELSSSLPVIPALTESEQSLSSSDKISQCNLDSEYGKSFLMFEEDDNFLDIRLPMRRESNKVYNIEDVASRLNCSTLQVKKFSKTTQNLMARTKTDSLVHTRQVVDEIRQLTKTLKFNKCVMERPEDGSSKWCNINWGDDAPYWNQYYKVVKEYNCPFETKSEECRILDLISEEINHLIDTQCDEARTCLKNRLEIPLIDLMSVVQHITDDIDMVRELLEWNGYEIANDVVIHSRLAVDIVSVGTHDEDWPDNVSNSSDWDNVTEVPSTTVSEGSTIVPHYQDRCLRRALDHKLRNLRTMLTADEDITTELDKVVCKLMKLALRSSKRRTTPPPAKWMQCKLLDLLTLTEKAIERRKKHVIEASFTAIKFDFVEDESKQKISNLIDIEEDHIEKDSKDGYSNIIEAPPAIDNAEIIKCGHTDFDQLDDITSSTSNELKDYDFTERNSSNKIASPATLIAEALKMKSELNPMERTKAWLNVDVEGVAYHKQDMSVDENNSLEDSDSDTNLKHKQKKLRHRTMTNKEIETLCLTSSSRTSSNKYKSKREEKKRKTSSTRVTKKVTRRISANYNIIKNSDSKNWASYNSYITRPKRKTKENQCLTMRASKPIPESLIELCHPELKCGEQCVKEFNILNNIDTTNNVVVLNQSNPTAAGEEDILIDIIMDDTPETISICEGTGINDEETEIADISNKDQIEELSNDIDINLCTRHEVSTENICAQTIFLNDINEPSTSKGIRHNVTTDVQCGPDTLAAYPTLSASTSLVRIPHGFSTGIKIHEGITEAVQGTDFGTSTQECGCDKILTPRSRSIGIKIKDSDVNICPTTYTSTMLQESAMAQNRSSGTRCWNTGPRSWSPESNTIICEKQVSFSSTVDNSSIKTELLKPISSISNADYSSSEFCASSIRKSLSQLDNSTKEIDEFLIMKSVNCKESKMKENIIDMKNGIPKLSCGGVHVHSYKDKQESEDIVYQGKWQRQCQPKIARKKTQNTILAKKMYDSGNRRQKELLREKRVNSREKISAKKPEKKEYKADYKKTLQMRNNTSILQRAKQETEAKKVNPHGQSVKTANVSKLSRQIINVTKVASKIAMSSIASKNIKSAFTTKKPQLTSTVTVKKDANTHKLKKSYIPLYMRKRNAQMLRKNNFNESIDSLDVFLEENKEIGNKDLVSLMPLKTDEMKKDLLHFQGTVTENTYLVFRNENQDNCASTEEQQMVNPETNEDGIIQNDNYIKRTRSHQSLNSSTCSSPNSIVTVRAVHTKSKNLSYRRHSASSHKSSLNTSESDNPTPTKTKKSLKRCKTAKKPDSNKDSNNKENIPETAENFSSKEAEMLAKSPYVGHQQQHKNICIAQLKADRSSMQTMTSKHKTLNKSNIKIPTPQDTIDKKRSLSASVSRKRSFQSRTPSTNDMVPSKNISDGGLESANMVLVLNPQEQVSVPNVIPADTMESSIENNVNTARQQSSEVVEISNIANDMKLIIEEMLHLIDFSSTIHSDSVILCSDDILYCSVDANDSLSSFVTVTGNYLNSTLVESDKEMSLDRTFDTVLGNESTVSLANTRLTVTDFDLLSFKSVTSVSKDSEYFMADSELNATIGGVENSQGSVAAVVPIAVTDIFERKEQHLMQNPPGSLAFQAFSGFSLDGECIINDHLDPVSLIDSETGSMAMGPTRVRQATSEEVFISGRSSESYQSCLIDEDAVVPNWLFQMISQQHSQVVEDPPMIGPQPVPLAQDSDYDVNGNPIEAGLIDAGAGAGDGHGIHSDQSQDSSGRGTSLSSSDTSSSPQSEAILIDPSAFSGQIELLRDPATSSALTSQSVNEDSSREECSRSTEGTEHVTTGRRRPRAFPIASSDISADVSSIDTDAPDSSD